MKPRVRLTIFFAASVVFAALFVLALLQLHPVGAASEVASAYGKLVNSATVPERHITNAVTAVNFDFRAVDTLGEEFILFSCVMAVLLLLRRQKDESDGPPKDSTPGRRISAVSDAVRLLAVALVGPTVLFGIYVVVHGQVTPGGGFQGGVVLATAPLLIYLAGEFRALRKVAPRWLVEIGESIGAEGYIAVGVAGFSGEAPFLHNFLPLGQTGDVLSGGSVALIDLAVGLEVACGFVLLLVAFLEETLVRRDPV